MDFSPVGRICSFCGMEGDADTKFAGGLGAMICADCLDFYHEVFSSPRRQQALTRPPWEEMSDSELLEKLPLIMRSQQQATRFLADWVALIRARKTSWAAIGRVMGMSRQAAWERFSKAEARANEAAS